MRSRSLTTSILLSLTWCHCSELKVVLLSPRLDRLAVGSDAHGDLWRHAVSTVAVQADKQTRIGKLRAPACDGCNMNLQAPGAVFHRTEPALVANILTAIGKDPVGAVVPDPLEVQFQLIEHPVIDADLVRLQDRRIRSRLEKNDIACIEFLGRLLYHFHIAQ